MGKWKSDLWVYNSEKMMNKKTAVRYWPMDSGFLRKNIRA
jgi:hypothetical protein